MKPTSPTKAQRRLCKATGKVRYPDEETARHLVAMAILHNATGTPAPQRAYECDSCHGWHLTSLKTFTPRH